VITPKKQELKSQIEAWKNRAEMARRMGQNDLAEEALERMRKLENDLARLQEFEVDES
jgi:phage shock protein A